MSDKIDISPEAVEQLARDLPNSQWQAPNLHLARKTLRALRARLAEVEKRAEAARWNVDEDGNLVRLCRGDHDKYENCSDHEELFVPIDRAERAEAALATARRDALDLVAEALNAEGVEVDDDIWCRASLRALANEAETSARGMP